MRLCCLRDFSTAWWRLISEVASATRRKPIDLQDEVNAAIRRERRAAMGARVRHRSPGRGECRSSSGTKCGHGAHGCISNILKCAQATLIRNVAAEAAPIKTACSAGRCRQNQKPTQAGNNAPPIASFSFFMAFFSSWRIRSAETL